MPESVLEQVRGVPGVARAEGDVVGYAQIVDPATGKVDRDVRTADGRFRMERPERVHAQAGRVAAERARPGRDRRRNGAGARHPGRRPRRDRVRGSAGRVRRRGDRRVRRGRQPGRGDVGAVRPADRAAGAGQGGRARLGVGRGGRGRLGRPAAATIGEVLPKGVEAVTAATVTSEAQDQISTGLGFLRTAFLVFAFVALFVGAFIIFNTFAIIVAQRTRELALFRALGASGRQVMTSVMVEATVIGIVSSLLGVLAGIGIAILLKGALSATGLEIPSSGHRDPRPDLRRLDRRRHARHGDRRAGPGAPGRQGGADRGAARGAGPPRSLAAVPPDLGAGGAGLGIVPLVYGLFGTPENALQLVGLGVALTFVGVAMLTPLIARPIAGAIGLPIRKTGVPGKLGGENSMRNPRRTAATASALMIGLGLVVFVAVFGASAKASTTEILDRTLKADFILTSPTFTGFSTAAAEDLRGVQGVETVSQVRQGEVHINGRDVVRHRVWTRRPSRSSSELGVTDGSLDELQGANTIAVFDDTAADNGWSVGDTIDGRVPRDREGGPGGGRALFGERPDRGLRALARHVRRERRPAARHLRPGQGRRGRRPVGRPGRHRDRADALPERRGAGPGRSSATSTRRS